MNSFNKFEEVSICDLCGSSDIDWLHKDSCIKKCSSCGFVFASPRPTFDEIQQSYSDDSFYDGWLKDLEGRKKLWFKRYKRIKKFVKQHSKLLDYSAGVGTFLHFVQMDGHEIFGTEISKSAKKIARQNYGIVLNEDEDLLNGQHQKYYDIITVWHVLEHVGSPTELLKKFHKALQDRGVLVIAVPNNFHKPLKDLFFFKKHDYDLLYPTLVPGSEIHLSYFNLATIRLLLDKCGFRLVCDSIDDHFASPNWKTKLKYYIYVILLRITGINYSETIFIIANKIRSNIIEKN